MFCCSCQLSAAKNHKTVLPEEAEEVGHLFQSHTLYSANSSGRTVTGMECAAHDIAGTLLCFFSELRGSVISVVKSDF